MKPNLPKVPPPLKLERFQGRLFLNVSGLPSQDPDGDVPSTIYRGEISHIGQKIQEDFRSTAEITKWVKQKLGREIKTIQNKLERNKRESEILEQEVDIFMTALDDLQEQ